MNANQIKIETKETTNDPPLSHLDQNKEHFTFWKETLVQFGYTEGHHSFLDPSVTKEGKKTDAQIDQSLRLRHFAAATAAKRKNVLTSEDSLLFQFFDLTTVHQYRLFEYWDEDGDGSINVDEFIAGLKSQNLNVASDVTTKQRIAQTLSGTDDYPNLKITFRMFSTFLHRTKMAILFDEPLRRQVYSKIKGHRLFLQDPIQNSDTHPPCSNSDLLKPTTSLSLSHRPSLSSKNLPVPTYVPTAELLIVDYNKSTVKIGCANPDSEGRPQPFTLKNEDAKGYFFGSRDPGFTMRWVSVMKPDPISIITVAVKYRLHPLALEDMLELNLQRPKVDKYAVHYFVVFPALRLTETAIDMMLTDKWNINDPHLCELWDASGKDPATSLVEMQNYCLCVGGPNRKDPEFSYDTVISVEAGFAQIIPLPKLYQWNDTVKTKQTTSKHTTHKASTSPRGAAADSVRLKRSKTFVRRAMTYDGGTHLGYEDFTGGFRHDIFQLLGTDFSRLRMQRSVFMMYQLMNSGVEKIAPVLKMYRKRLDWYAYQIRKQRWKFGDRIRGLLDTKRELDYLKDIIIPCSHVVRHIIADEDLAPEDSVHCSTSNNDGMGRLFKKKELMQYFKDIDDRLVLYIDKLENMSDLCDSYNQEYKGYGDKRMNDILFALTIVTTIFVPAQFFTGVFGMNFVQPDGTPNMPLLNWEYGYFFFWVLSLGLTFLTFLILFINGWMPCQGCNRCAEEYLVDEEDV